MSRTSFVGELVGLLLTSVTLAGCGDDTSAACAGDACLPAPCPAGEHRRDADGRCIAPGLPPDLPCPPGEQLRESDGACVAAGVPQDGCGEGFVYDGDRGCEPILPAAPCPPGSMAVPGDSSCREVAPCGAGTWGDIAVEADTQYVDANHAGTSDGSAAQPWTRIQDGVDVAAPGAIVAVAQGSYAEALELSGKAVRLWGRCPARVELIATGTSPENITIGGGADGSEIRGIAITGPGLGISIQGAGEIVGRQLWIHDNDEAGVAIIDSSGTASLELADVLIEGNASQGLFVVGSAVKLSGSVVRTTVAGAGGTGKGVSVQWYPSTGARAQLEVHRSLIEGNQDAGLHVSATDATVSSLVVRDTLPGDDGKGGWGVSLRAGAGMDAGTLDLQTSLIEDNHQVGIMVRDSTAKVSRTVVRGTQTDAGGLFGRGVSLHVDDADPPGASLELSESLVDHNHDVGVHVQGADARLVAVAIRDTMANDLGTFGRGINLQQDAPSGLTSDVDIESSLIERSHQLGIYVAGSQFRMQGSVVRDTLPAPDGGGRAVQIQRGKAGAASVAELRASLLERAVDSQVAAVGDVSVTLESCHLLSTMAADGILGDGLVVASYNGLAEATLVHTRIENSHRAAISAFGGEVWLSRSHLLCQAFDLAAEPWEDRPSAFIDGGDNLCGCPQATTRCRAQSYQLEPPPLLEVSE